MEPFFPDEITILTQPTCDYLNPREKSDYEYQRRECLSWLLTFEKRPENAEGYTTSTVKTRSLDLNRTKSSVHRKSDQGRDLPAPIRSS
jgi:hypothetical protein